MNMQQLLTQSQSVGEKNDCAVKAVAAATEVDYFEVRKVMAALGRRSKKATPQVITKKSLRILGFLLEDVTKRFRSRTVRTLEREMKSERGAFLIWVRGHVLCVRDGTVYDWTRGKCHRVIRVCRLHKVKSPRREVAN